MSDGTVAEAALEVAGNGREEPPISELGRSISGTIAPQTEKRRIDQCRLHWTPNIARTDQC